MSAFRAAWRFFGSIECAILVCMANVIAVNIIGDYTQMSVWIVGTLVLTHMRDER